MPQNFIECDREQAFLLPPSLREWLPEDHLAWFVLEAVEELDLAEFYADYREDGHGRAAYEPSMMVALVLYAYATKQRSSRAIERHCRQDIAYRVITANRVADHATIARFVARHERALGELFGSVLALCARAGLVSTGVVAIDGTKLHANASREANSDYERIAREIVAEARATDEAEDELYGQARGDELPEELRTSAGRRKWLREAKQALDQESTTDPPPAAEEPADEPPSMPRGRAKDQGRRGWRRDARQRLDERRAREARPIPRSRTARLSESKRRLEEELEAERDANEAYEAYRARGISRDGRRFGGGPPSPHQVPDTPTGKINTTDPDSRLLKVTGGYVQGYNAQAAVSEEQIVLAAEISVDSPDFGHLEPIVEATTGELAKAGVSESPEVVVADAGYWHNEQIDSVAANGIAVLIPPDAKKRRSARPGWQGGRYEWMRKLLATELGERLYRKRSQTVEPMFGHTKHNRRMSRFHRRGRSAARTEWRLITATHNLTKLHSHTLAAATA
ncbi:MAG: transposase [Actinobacteria bacterium]|nr:transposase [Actinomycetota bacterium]MCA1700685.1 transposase [Actinomycetota bacterium]